MSTHTCPAPGCSVEVERSKLACPKHWWSIPKRERDEVWRTYRRCGMGSPEHAAAIVAAVATLS